MNRLAILLLAAACASDRPAGRVVDFLGGAHAHDLIIGAATARVEAYRIDGGPRMKPTGGEEMHGYPVLAGPVAVDAKSRGELADVLTSDATYLWDVAKACAFMPGVLVRYEGTERIDVLLCFSCDELAIYRNGKLLNREDFDPRRKDLVRVVQRLFPADPALAKLK